MKKSLLFAAGLLIAAGAFAPVQAKLRMPHIFTDNMATEPGSATTARDRYYEYVFGLTGSDGPSKLAGVNFWGWGGSAVPKHKSWKQWDPYTGDPAQEDQGLNSVFSADRSTIEIIRRANR